VICLTFEIVGGMTPGLSKDKEQLAQGRLARGEVG
jgi:hypothetical protein